MTKSKSSTIAIVVLSVLLAAALASTIVLAAFTQTRTATTTITFAQGLTLTLSSDDANVTIADEGAGNITISKTDILTNTADLVGAINANPSRTAFIGFKVAPTVSGGYTLGAGVISGQTLYYPIKVSETTKAFMVFTAATGYTWDSENIGVAYTATALNSGSAAMLSSIAIKAVDNDAPAAGYATVDGNLEGLNITATLTKVFAKAAGNGATSADVISELAA